MAGIILTQTSQKDRVSVDMGMEDSSVPGEHSIFNDGRHFHRTDHILTKIWDNVNRNFIFISPQRQLKLAKISPALLAHASGL